MFVVPLAALARADKRRSLFALISLDAEVELLLPILATAMKDTSALVRHRAIDALAEMGPSAKPLIDPLIEALDDREAEVRRSEGPYRISRSIAASRSPDLPPKSHGGANPIPDPSH